MHNKNIVSVALILGLLGIFMTLNIQTVKATWVEGHITQDTTWKIQDSPFIVTNDVTVDANSTLTIESGVEVRFGGSFSLIVEGSLFAIGNETSKIHFTSNKLQPAKGDWTTISDLGVNSTSQIEYAVIEFATSGVTLNNYGTSARAVIEKSTISENSQDGIHLVHTNNTIIEDCNIVNNRQNGIGADSWAIGAENMQIKGNVIESNVGGDGIYLYGHGSGSKYRNILIYNNTINSNRGNGIRCTMQYYAEVRGFSVIGNQIIDNGQTGICLQGDPWYDTNGYDLFVSMNSIRNNLNGIALSGLTSYNLTISNNVVVSNSEDGITLGADFRSTDITVENNVFSSNNRGVYVGAGGFPPVIVTYSLLNNSVSYNTYGFYIETNRIGELRFNDIYGNKYGMNITSHSYTTNAEYNYWGDSSGPYHPSLNPLGKGNPVNGDGTDLDFIPFLTMPVGSINEKPIARIAADKTNPNVGETVTFDASHSTDDGRIDSYFFDFGDGTNSSWIPLSVVTHKYLAKGNYNATLVVMDDFGVTSLGSSQSFTIVNVVPEFPSFLILSLFMIATLLAGIAYRKKGVKTSRS